MNEKKRNEHTAHAAAIAHLETNQALGSISEVVEGLTEHPEAVDRAEHQLTEACDATRSAALALWLVWQGTPMPVQDADAITKAISSFDDWLCKLADEHDLPFE